MERERDRDKHTGTVSVGTDQNLTRNRDESSKMPNNTRMSCTWDAEWHNYGLDTRYLNSHGWMVKGGFESGWHSWVTGGTRQNCSHAPGKSLPLHIFTLGACLSICNEGVYDWKMDSWYCSQPVTSILVLKVLVQLGRLVLLVYNTRMFLRHLTTKSEEK